MPALVALSVLAGVILGEFAGGVVPTAYLLRPLVVSVLASIVVGGLSLLAGRHAIALSAGASLVLAAPNRVSLLFGLIAAVIVVGSRVVGSRVGLTKIVPVMAAVFCLGGVLRAVPHLSLSIQEAPRTEPGPPVYMILLDGYPRADTLAELGIDVEPFLFELEMRGFKYHPDAHTLHGWTHHTMTAMLIGRVDEDTAGTIGSNRATRQEWQLPGFVTIPPPVGSVTIPNSYSISGGINDFEIRLLGSSAAGPFVGNFVMAQLRNRIDESLRVLATTRENRVFAHLMVPHPPFLYQEHGPAQPPECWPGCNLFASPIEDTGMTLDEWTTGMSNTLDYLNRSLLEVVDQITTRHPDAIIALFSDHGGRYSWTAPDEWHRSFLATRGVSLTESRPDVLFRLYQPASVASQ